MPVRLWGVCSRADRAQAQAAAAAEAEKARAERERLEVVARARAAAQKARGETRDKSKEERSTWHVGGESADMRRARRKFSNLVRSNMLRRCFSLLNRV